MAWSLSSFCWAGAIEPVELSLVLCAPPTPTKPFLPSQWTAPFEMKSPSSYCSDRFSGSLFLRLMLLPWEAEQMEHSHYSLHSRKGSESRGQGEQI